MLTNIIKEGITQMKKRELLEGQSQSPLKSSSLDSVTHCLFKKEGRFKFLDHKHFKSVLGYR